MASIIEEDYDLVNTSLLNARVFSIIAQNTPYNTDEPNLVEESESTKAKECLPIYLRIKNTRKIENLYEIKNENLVEESESTKAKECLPIYLRIKNTRKIENLYEIKNENTLLSKIPKSVLSNRNVGIGISKAYKFSKIFGPDSSQSHIFTEIIRDKLLDFINGINCTLLTYGASGSGKTFTIVGNSEEPGIIPRSLEFLFGALPELSQNPVIKPKQTGGIRTLSSVESINEGRIKSSLLSKLQDLCHHQQIYSEMQQELQGEVIPVIDEDISDVHLGVWVSYVEIYNEYVYDLLAPPVKHGQIRKKLRLVYYDNNAYVKDLQYVNVSTASEAYCILQYGLQNLKYAATSINDHSSRSHSIFTIRLAQASDTKDGISVSSFNFCDLAGSERIKKTNNIGDRLKESNNINRSLLVLGRCITAVRDAQKLNNTRIIPFRDSKLTQLLQNALSGNEAISMIVNINPIIEMFDETQHVLNFSAIAKEVCVERQQFIGRPKENTESSTDDNVEELKLQLTLLCDQIEQENLDYEEEVEYIIQKYKEILSKTNDHWESVCQKLQNRILENKLRSYDHLDTSQEENEKKRKKMSIIIVDSSSEDEAEENDDKENLNRSNSSSNRLRNLQGELRVLKNEFDGNEIVLQQILHKNNTKKELIEESKNTYNKMQREYDLEVERLNDDILKQENTILELNNYIESNTPVKKQIILDTFH